MFSVRPSSALAGRTVQRRERGRTYCWVRVTAYRFVAVLAAVSVEVHLEVDLVEVAGHGVVAQSLEAVGLHAVLRVLHSAVVVARRRLHPSQAGRRRRNLQQQRRHSDVGELHVGRSRERGPRLGGEVSTVQVDKWGNEVN